MYALKVEVDNDFKNDLLFEFEEMKEMVDFVKTFESHCNTVCQYSLGIGQDD